jgi:hypothetical protein
MDTNPLMQVLSQSTALAAFTAIAGLASVVGGYFLSARRSRDETAEMLNRLKEKAEIEKEKVETEMRSFRAALEELRDNIVHDDELRTAPPDVINKIIILINEEERKLAGEMAAAEHRSGNIS